MLDLSEVGIRITVVHQRIQKFGCLPNGLRPLLKTEISLLFIEDIVERLALMIRSIKLSDARSRGRVVNAKLFLRLALFVAALKKLVPLFQILERCVIGNTGC